MRDTASQSGDESHHISCAHAQYSIRKIFVYYDRDGDGTISRAEIHPLLRRLGSQLSADQLTTMLAELDPTESGAVEFGDFVGWWTIFDIEAVFNAYDDDKSGTIELTELKHVVRDLGVQVDPDKLAVQLIKFDEDGSGDISFAEFLPWWREVVTRNQQAREVSKLQKNTPNGGSNATTDDSCDNKPLNRLQMWKASDVQQRNAHTAQRNYVELNRLRHEMEEQHQQRLREVVVEIAAKYALDAEELVLEFF